MSVKDLFEKRGKLVARILELRDKASGREFTDEEKTNWEAVNKDELSLKAQIDRELRAEELKRDHETASDDWTKRMQPTKQECAELKAEIADRDLALQTWGMRCLGRPITKVQMDACERVGIYPDAKHIDIPLPTIRDDYRVTPVRQHLIRHANVKERVTNRLMGTRELRADLALIPESVGGVTVAEGFVPNLEEALLAFNGMRQVASVMRTDTGADLPWPDVNDTSNEGEIVGEAGTVSEQNTTFGATIFKAFKFSSKAIPVTSELLQDSAFNIAALIGGWLGVRIARHQATQFTTGTGAGAPLGITLASTLGKTTASSTTMEFNELLDLIYSVDAAYRAQSTFMMHENVILELRQKLDGESRHLWQAGVTAGEPDTLHGFPVVTNLSMSSTITSGDITVEFGDFSKYLIREVSSIRLIRDDSIYVLSDRVAFLAWLRADGNLRDAGTNPVKHMVQV